LIDVKHGISGVNSAFFGRRPARVTGARSPTWVEKRPSLRESAMKLISIARLVIVLVPVLAACGIAPAQSYDLGADWNQSANPNGPWSFRQGGALLPVQSAWLPWGPLAPPAYANAPQGAGHIPAMMKAPNVPGGWDVLPGDVVFHSFDAASGGTNGEGTIVWTAPAAGSVSIAGAVWIARDIGRSLVWSLLVNGATITSGGVASGDAYSRSYPMAFAAGSGGPGVLHGISVNTGDTIAFMNVTTPGTYYGDFITVNLAIAYGAPDASWIPVGSGCGNPTIPVMSAQTPVTGAPITLAIANGTPNASGALYFSGVPAFPLAIGGGCTVYLDLASLTFLLPLLTNGSGAWSVTAVVPFAPGLAGAQFVLQGVLLPTAGPLGFDLTNGVLLLVGY
jgi:hypothetical protein